MYPRLKYVLFLSGAAALAAACDPNVVIGAKWRVDRGDDAGPGGQAGSGGSDGGTVSGGGGTEPEVALAGASGAADGGAAGAGAGGAPALGDEWCATAPWVNSPVQFTSDTGNDDGDVIPAGSYWVTYVSGAQIHDLDIGYGVTRHYYGENGIKAGHHIFSGDSPETGATSLWLDDSGITGWGGTIAEVEEANRGHTWPLEHAGGELYITLYDDYYGDNSGPGSRFCIVPATP